MSFSGLKQRKNLLKLVKKETQETTGNFFSLRSVITAKNMDNETIVPAIPRIPRARHDGEKTNLKPAL
jgi:hypothetical protein